MIRCVHIIFGESAVRILVDIPDGQIKDLAAICETEKVSRVELIRQAISAYLEKKKPGTANAFGLWRDREVDGQAYQERVRSEW